MNARTALRALAVLLPLAARADSLSFTYSASIYQDAKEVALRSPEGVACTGGSLVVADTGNRRLLTFALKESGIISQTGEVKLGQLTSPVELKGAPATPMILGFKLDAADNLYALDVASGKVLVADLAGSVIRAVDLPKGPVISDIAADGGGTIYAVDGVGATVWSAAKGATAFTQLGKSLKDRMSFPSYIVAHQGKLILVDQNGMGLVLLGLDGSYLGRQLAIGWNDGFVYYPSQLCINEKGDSFVADRGNNRVQQFTTAR